ncbi:hypothetical protein QNI16_17540 [Cytophagaceae bacterium YF14B1]|uniref:Uncharacterized protein n=1 Tax=Xanthocytophaga flava TaxID=3048013 RepID=A0AAE3U9I9_9BACT|nr:hypothetical protein [Xanthocytophaga flavus]MDJ1482313.1 hypothetical protein [Xanthocytophaga flavus]
MNKDEVYAQFYEIVVKWAFSNAKIINENNQLENVPVSSSQMLDLIYAEDGVGNGDFHELLLLVKENIILAVDQLCKDEMYSWRKRIIRLSLVKAYNATGSKDLIEVLNEISALVYSMKISD